MNKFKKINGIVFLMLLLLLSASVFAGDADRIGTAAGVQVLVPVGARDLAMGGADIVFTRGIDAIYWNPAGLSHLEGRAMGTFSTVTIFSDIKVNYLAVGANMGSLGHVGFSIKSFDFGDIPMTTVEDMDGATGKTYSPTFSTIGLTYANKLTNAIQVGVTAKLIHEAAPRVSATAFAFDIGLQYQNLAGLQGVSFGVAVKNIGSNMQYAGSGLTDKITESDSRQEYLTRNASSDQLPANIELGLAYDFQIVEKQNLIFAGMFQSNNIENDAVKFGLEYKFANLVALRGGYIYSADPDIVDYSFTFGGGLQYSFGGTLLGVDYAFRNSQYFDANNMFTLKVGF